MVLASRKRCRSAVATVASAVVSGGHASTKVDRRAVAAVYERRTPLDYGTHRAPLKIISVIGGLASSISRLRGRASQRITSADENRLGYSRIRFNAAVCIRTGASDTDT
jgi:hypothetical protein